MISNLDRLSGSDAVVLQPFVLVMFAVRGNATAHVVTTPVTEGDIRSHMSLARVTEGVIR